MLAIVSGAFGYFSAAVAPGAAGAAAATSVNQGNTPTAVVSGDGRSVTVSWSSSTLTDGAAVDGYLVKRYDAISNVAQTIGASCQGTVVATSCSEQNVPAGSWKYAIVPLKGTFWQGGESAKSTSVTITTASSSLALTKTTFGLGDFSGGGGGSTTLTGTLGGFAANEGITFRLDNAASGTVLTGSPSSANASGNASVSITLPRPADAPHTIYAVGNVSPPSQAAAAILVDTVSPSTTDNSATIGNSWFNSTKTVTLTPTDPGGSGVAATYYTSNGTTPTTGSSQGTSVVLATDGLYTAKYFSVDNAANQESVKTASTVIRIDKTNPTPGTFTLAASIKNGQILTNAATDATVNGASSGVASVTYYYCSGAGCTPNTLIGSSTTSPSYTVAWNSQPADGSYRVAARATDTAGNSVSSGVATTTVDNTGPTVSPAMADATTNQAGYINGGGTYYVYANVTDAGSGVNAGTITANVGNQSTTCSPNCTAVPLSSSGGPFTVLGAGGTTVYTYRSALLTAKASPTTTFTVAAQDNLANSVTANGTVTVDAAGNPGTPAAVHLLTGTSQTAATTCATTQDGYIDAARQRNESIDVTTASNSPANGVVRVTASDGTRTLTFDSVVSVAGTLVVHFTGLDLSSLNNAAAFGTKNVTLTAKELSSGGNGTSAGKSVTVSKWTTSPSIDLSKLTYTDNTSATADRVAGSNGAAAPTGFVVFTQTAGPHVGNVYSTTTGAGGNFAAFNVDAVISTPTYSVTTVDGACNGSAAVSYSPTDVK